MSDMSDDSHPAVYGQAIWTGILSGVVSALSFEPVGGILETIDVFDGELIGLLSMMGLSAGLVFGGIGAAFGMRRLRFRVGEAGLWLCASILGMSAAFYVAIWMYDSGQAPAPYVVPYLAASPVGAMILGGPLLAWWRVPGLAMHLAALVIGPTLWAVGIAFAMLLAGTDDALTVPWLAALYCGWQVIFLTLIARARRG